MIYHHTLFAKVFYAKINYKKESKIFLFHFSLFNKLSADTCKVLHFKIIMKFNDHLTKIGRLLTLPINKLNN